MQISVLYRQQSDHARPVKEFMEMVKRKYPDLGVEELELDSRTGSEKAAMYGVVAYPAVMVLSEDGSVRGLWEGQPLPLIDEVAALAIE